MTRNAWGVGDWRECGKWDTGNVGGLMERTRGGEGRKYGGMTEEDMGPRKEGRKEGGEKAALVKQNAALVRCKYIT